MVVVIMDPMEELKKEQDTRVVLVEKKTKKLLYVGKVDKGEKHKVDTSKLPKNTQILYKYQVKNPNKESNRVWVDATKYFIFYPEINGFGLKYLLYRKLNAPKLLVVFQAINVKPSYNYVGATRNLNVHRLFIKDDYIEDIRTKSSYYIDGISCPDLEKKVEILIKKVLSETGLTMEDVILAGSSKGGFASLYHGYKLGVGHIISGGPQILLGNYLSGSHKDNSIGKDIFKRIFGDLNPKNLSTANDKLRNVLIETHKRNIDTNIHVGYWELHFRRHVEAFMGFARESGLENISLDVREYDSHDHLAQYYPPFLVKKVKDILGTDE